MPCICRRMVAAPVGTALKAILFNMPRDKATRQAPSLSCAAPRPYPHAMPSPVSVSPVAGKADWTRSSACPSPYIATIRIGWRRCSSSAANISIRRKNPYFRHAEVAAFPGRTRWRAGRPHLGADRPSAARTPSRMRPASSVFSKPPTIRRYFAALFAAAEAWLRHARHDARAGPVQLFDQRRNRPARRGLRYAAQR